MPLDEKTRELIAVAASIAVSSPPEVKVHVARARDLGANDEDLTAVVEIGRIVRTGAAAKADLFAASVAVTPVKRQRGGCHGGGLGLGLGGGGGCGCKEPEDASVKQ
jgi:AhpD family alkylhydroperoxidase